MKAKLFRLPEPTAKDFEVLCTLLGISQRQAAEIALRDWIRRNRGQVSLETWTEARGSVAPLNTALIKLQVTILKADLKEISEVLDDVDPRYRIEFLRKAQKMIPTAQALVEETGDQELRQIVAEIVQKVAP